MLREAMLLLYRALVIGGQVLLDLIEMVIRVRECIVYVGRLQVWMTADHREPYFGCFRPSPLRPLLRQPRWAPV